jgi:DNA-binding MarR family transcriptional regulator
VLRRVRREDEAAGLGPARLSALSVIVFGGPIRISDLARAEQVRTPTMTPIVAALERAGLVRREADASDARAVRLHATAKGRRLMAEGRGRRVARLAADLRALSAAERDAVERAAAILLRLFRPAQPPRPRV